MKDIIFDFIPSIDYVDLSIKWSNNQKLSRAIKKHCELKKHNRFTDGFYEEILCFELQINNSNYKLQLMYPHDTFLPICLKMIHPDKQLIDYIDHLLMSIDYAICKIEITYDFITEDLSKLFQFFKSSAYLKQPGKQLTLQYENTHYLNNPRKASKSCRIYIKSKDVLANCVRIEFIFKRDILKKNNIIVLQHIEKIDSQFIEKYFELREYNFDVFDKRFLYYCKDNRGYLSIYRSLTRRIDLLMKEGKLKEANAVPTHIWEDDNLKKHIYHNYFLNVLKSKSILK